jgi:hypothetical protein
MNLDEIENRIEMLANELVNCRMNCKGIRNEPKNGIIPRCLILERSDNDKKVGCIIMGINPGTPREPSEYKYYKDNSPVNYKILLNCFKLKIGKKPYFSRARKIVRQLGINGSILWTDMCKCQNMKKHKLPPPETFRRCIGKFLERELKLLPETIIIALGDDVFDYVCKSYTKRKVLGIPHTSYGTSIRKICNSKKEIKDVFKEKFQQLKKGNVDINCIKIP